MPSKRLSIYGEFGSKQSTILPLDYTSSDPPAGPFYINAYFETYKSDDQERELAICKRPGVVRAEDAGLTALTGLPDDYVIQGVATSFDRTTLIFYMNNGSANRCYHFDGTTLTNKNAAPAVSGNWTYSGPVVFTNLDGISYGSARHYAATDFTKGAVINSTGDWTEITDADFTGLTKVTNFCAMDGYLFIGTSNNRIYNSDLNDAVTWQSTSFLTAADTPGALMWLARLRNYLIAFKANSIEFFEDTGNPTPGSPLTPQKQLNKKVGLANKGTVKEVSDGIIFLGISEKGKIEVYKIMKNDLSLKIISNQYIEQAASGYIFSTTYSVDPATGNGQGGEAQVINYRGKEFYALYLLDTGVYRTFLYDNDLETWSRWATCVTGHNTLDANFTPCQSVMFQKGTTLYNLMAQNVLSATTVPPYFVCLSPSNTDFSDSGAAEDTTVYAYPLIWVSDVYDFGNRRRKFMDSLEVVYDTYNADSGNSGTLTLYYGDSDFNVTSPNVKVTRTINYDKNNNASGRAIIRRLGSFRKRWFALKQTDTTNFYPFRIWAIEVKYNNGETDQES